MAAEPLGREPASPKRLDEAACVSLLGGIQPRPLAAYLRETFGRGKDDGLIQRFQLLVYPDVAATWRI